MVRTNPLFIPIWLFHFCPPVFLGWGHDFGVLGFRMNVAGIR